MSHTEPGGKVCMKEISVCGKLERISYINMKVVTIYIMREAIFRVEHAVIVIKLFIFIQSLMGVSNK